VKTKSNLQHYGLSLLVATKRCVGGLTAGATLMGATASVEAADAKKPNRVVNWGDDIGYPPGT